MKFAAPLFRGTLVRRYKRFLADVDLGGEIVTAACPNTGSMLGCNVPGSKVWLSTSDSTTRKYRHTWELVEAAPRVLVGINTGLPNRLVTEGIADGVISQLSGYSDLRAEVRYGKENSRIDLLLEGGRRKKRCFVEVKNVTAAVTDGVALFPDSVSERGSKHLRELMQMVTEGYRAVMLYCVQRADVGEVRPADNIDPTYGATLRQALAHGVEAYAFRAKVTPREITLEQEIPVVCPALE